MEIELLKKLAEAHMPLADMDEQWEQVWKELINYARMFDYRRQHRSWY